MKVLSASRKYIRWLLWPGIALTTAGLVVGFVTTIWGTLPIVLLAVGLVLSLVSLLLGGFGYRRFWQSRSTQAGTNAVLATLSVVLILGVLNFLAVQYAPSLDLTEGGLFTLAPETQSVVKNLRQPVKVVVFDSSLNPNDKQLLDSYRKLNDAFTYEQVNPVQDPTKAREFNVSGAGREVHLVAGDDTLFVQPLGQGLNEQDLTNKLSQIGRDRNAVIYFLQGHDEFVIDGTDSGYTQAATALQDDSFTVEPLNLAETATVPSDATAVVVAGPKQALFEPETEALATYLDDGGSVLLLLDPQTEPELDLLLDDWGVALDERLIIDASNTGQIVGLGPAAPLVTTYGSHPITEVFNGGRSFYPLARPILLQPVEGIEATPLLLSNAQSYAEPLSESGELNVDTQKSPEGPFNIGVVLTKEVAAAPAESVDDPEFIESESLEQGDGSLEDEDIGDGSDDAIVDEPNGESGAADLDEEDLANEALEGNDVLDEETTPVEELSEGAESSGDVPNEGRLVVIGNATFATDGLFSQQLNGDVFLNSVTWLSNLEDTVLSIRPKEITNRRITMTISRQIVVIVLALLVFPVLGLLGAAATWFRRR